MQSPRKRISSIPSFEGWSFSSDKTASTPKRELTAPLTNT